MPFESKSQARYLFANKPGIAQRWARKTRNFTALPERKKSVRRKALERMRRGK